MARENSPGVYFNSPNTSSAGLSKLASHSPVKETQTYKDKLNKYLTQRTSGNNKPAKIEVPSLSNLLKNDTSQNINLERNKNEDIYKTDKKLKIEIKSRDLTRKIVGQGSFDDIGKKQAPEEDRSKKTEDRMPPTLKTIEATPTYKANLFRAKSDTENDRVRGSSSEKKFREESTRPSKPPIIYTIKWTNHNWPRVEEVIRVDKILGQGSFAKVYQGFDLVAKTIVAIKILDKRKIAELGFQKMAEKEVEIIQSINHPNICKFEKMLEDKNRVSSLY